MSNKIIIEPFALTMSQKNNLENKELDFGFMLQTGKTDCPYLLEKKIKSRIDYLTVQFKCANTIEFTIAKSKIKDWLKGLRIKVTSSKPSLKYFDFGALLNSYDVDIQRCGSLKWKSNSRLLQLELTGYACELINMHSDYFFPLIEISKSIPVDIKRIDIALDDKSGKYNMRFAQKRFSSGAFNARTGAKPLKESIKSNSGRSMYIGSKRSNKQMVIYEKGKQLELPKNHKDFNNWTRHELRLKARSDAPIPLDILLKPDDYFVGSYPRVYQRMLKVAEPRNVTRETIARCGSFLSKKLSHLKRQYGSTITLAKQSMTDAEIIKEIERVNKKFQPSLPLNLLTK